MRKQLLLLSGFVLFSLVTLALRTITGKITDDKGAPMANVSVIVKGTSTGTTSKADGSYSITVPANAKALALVNAVCQRSDATTTLAPADQTALINAILLERRIEFLGEGLRNLDHMRLLQTIPAKGSVAAKAAGEQGYIWPISADELSLNPLMTDN